jgi:hypothetical protein
MTQSGPWPGASVLFARGGVWRGTLDASTGNATHTTRYAAYGDPSLPKPLLLGSLPASAESDWRRTGRAGVWAADVAAKWAAVSGEAKGSPHFSLGDIGNLILGDGAAGAAGWRVWDPSELEAQDQWFFAGSLPAALVNHSVPLNESTLLFFSPKGNPAAVHGTIECAANARGKDNIINLDGRASISPTGARSVEWLSNVIVEELAVR